MINKKQDKSGIADYFCRPGHTVTDLQIAPILQMNSNWESVRRAKEQYLIGLANTFAQQGMNRTTDR